MFPDGLKIDVVARPSGNKVVLVSKPLAGCLTEPPVPGEKKGTVQFYVPFTAVDPVVAANVPAGTIWYDVSSSPFAYFGALLTWWEKGQTFAVIEHDVICRPDVVEAFENCPEPWCLYGYSDICHPGCQEAWRNQLGCTRFRSELITAVPDAVASIEPDNRDWHNLCDFVANNLRAVGFTHHWHGPYVDHGHKIQHREDRVPEQDKQPEPEQREDARPLERAVPPPKETR